MTGRTVQVGAVVAAGFIGWYLIGAYGFGAALLALVIGALLSVAVVARTS